MVSTALHAELFAGPLDVVGDIHGEIDALLQLLQHLGYNTQGEHPDGRHLVFLGDLCDRGPDSPAVIRLVRAMVERGVAQCLLGNHEVNVLRGVPKNGNGWFFDQAHNHDHARGRFLDSTPAEPDERAGIQAFFARLPLTLARADLRLVHAAWRADCIASTTPGELPDVLSMYAFHEQATEAAVTRSGLKAAMEAELRQWEEPRQNPEVPIPFLPALGEYDETYQMQNPVRVLTSGVERRTHTPFFAGGKWRMVERVPWWNDYHEPVPVLVGHYWRFADAATRELVSKGEEDLFAGLAINDWCGARNNVYCIDFSVGGRYKERLQGRHAHWGTRLGAVRWPEREVVFDEGQRLPLPAPSSKN